ncbi:MAG TPA: type I DNA topoisomerase [Polyangiaceae bacterium]
MNRTLVVVESPAKAKTIKKYLGAGYEVVASKGHIKDLPKKMGIDVERGFQETYEVIASKAKVLSELRSEAKKVQRLLLATDPDREGEAIAWHVAEELKHPKLAVQRVEFHEITKKGVEAGLTKPRKLDAHLYDAQRARRVLDRIVGYDVSALVWSKLAFGLSAGRVQSVALRLVVEREREIERFVPEEYWNIGVALRGAAPQPVHARLAKADGQKVEVRNGDDAHAIKSDLERAVYRVVQVTRREQKRNAPPPYTTSKLQQDATTHLRFTTRRTMNVAQRLYEGIDLKKDGGQVGLITYMRTDSVRVSADAIQEVRAYIQTGYGERFVPNKPNFFRAKKDAQDAHEAIRPTSLDLTPERVRRHLTDEQYKLYRLIWNRFVASQMASAIYDQTAVEIEASVANGVRHKSYSLRASGRVLKFSGWLEQYGKSDSLGGGSTGSFAGEEDAPSSSEGKAAGDGNGAARARAEDTEDQALPELSEGEKLTILQPPGVSAEQKFTQPPPRYNEGSLVRELEKQGIGRPSTYAEIISKVQAREYVEKLAGGQMKATELGKMVVDGLVSTELDFMDPSFTAKMEEGLDEVEGGRLERVELLSRFYERFRKVLERAKKQKRWAPEPEPTEFTCEECGSRLLKRWSKNGWFLGCEKYPTCKYTRDLVNQAPAEPKPTDIVCDKCGQPMVIKNGRYGEFLACSGYPKCKNAKPVPLGVPCPDCGGDIIPIRSKKRGARTFYGCSNYPECQFRSWHKPLAEPCPRCGSPFLTLVAGKAPRIACPKGKECGYSRPVEAPTASSEPSQASEVRDASQRPGAPGGRRSSRPASVSP